jgi:hypothetical protein
MNLNEYFNIHFNTRSLFHLNFYNSNEEKN